MTLSLQKTENGKQQTDFHRYDYWDRNEPKGWLTALVAVIWLALFLWLTCFAHCAETLRIPEDYPAAMAAYHLRQEIPRGRVLRGELIMDPEQGRAWIKAEVQLPNGLVVEIEKPIDPHGINPRRVQK